MLTRVYIDNFRSFVNFEYRPAKKQLLLGANGSGKSSLLEAIRYVKLFIAGEENPFTQLTRTRWQDRPLQVVEIDALLEGQEYQYRIETRFDSDTRLPSVNMESLKVSGTTSFDRTNETLRFSMRWTNLLIVERVNRTLNWATFPVGTDTYFKANPLTT
jgi:recombinational DNA repair ATPase RecF